MLPAWERTHRLSSILPQTGRASLFAANGMVRLLEIIGRVTAPIQDQPTNAKLVIHYPSGPDVDLCVPINIQNDAVGVVYSLSGTFTDAMRKTTCGGFRSQSNPIVIIEGTIDLVCDVASAGEVRWLARWAPLDAGADVVAV